MNNHNKQKYALIIGLGKSGMAAVRYLHAKGFQLAVTDAGDTNHFSKDDLEILVQLEVDLEFGGHTNRFLRDNCLVVPSPGVPLQLPLIEEARRRGCTIAGELALAGSELHIPTICITGTNGKTTVTSLIGELLRADGKKIFVGGNIGTPILEYLLAPENIEVAVFELSSFQLENMGSFHPHIAVLLNITPDHIDRHGSLENYVSAKQNIFANQNQNDFAIIGSDDHELLKLIENSPATCLRFGYSENIHASIKGTNIIITTEVDNSQEVEIYCLSNTNLLSGVNKLNAAAGILAAKTFGCSSDNIRQGLANFNPPAHRMSLVREHKGVHWINDSKATNLGAVNAALTGCEKPVILIAGGRAKDNDFEMLIPIVSKKVKKLLLIGEASLAMEKTLGPIVSTELMDDLESAVHRAAHLALPGNIVLLAPGCASFDMFRNYEERGEIFCKTVLALPEQNNLEQIAS